MPGGCVRAQRLATSRPCRPERSSTWPTWFSPERCCSHVQNPESSARAESLDHSVWFHGEVRADQWLLEATSHVLNGSRGLAVAHIYNESGALIATAAQEVQARQLG